MNKIDFAIVLHFHQPVGNFDSVLERVCRMCYKPFLKTLSRYPDVPMTFHISGSLFDYLETRHTGIVELIETMVKSGQVELMNGAYYEPILTAIPERDVIGQVKLMRDYLARRFQYTPQGMWVPEKIWDPRLAGTIAKVGARYCVLDEMHFLKARLDKNDTFGHYTTGVDARRLAVFSSDKRLRYAIPFKLPEETIGYFREVAAVTPRPLLVYSDDVEKFGEWPQTHEWVYGKGWLTDFFDTLTHNKEWITLSKLSDYLDTHKPLGELELPEGSYIEMNEWAGGAWKNFLRKYPEANQMHKKMWYVSSKIARAKKLAKAKDKERTIAAEGELYKGQCNCAYWHGLFGGLYFYHLRSAVYQHLITAERIADDILHKRRKQWHELKSSDFEGNGKKTYVLETPHLAAYIDPANGGVIKELDYRPHAINIINTLSRKQEPYIRECYPFDKYPRYCLRDHFLQQTVGPDDFACGCFEEAGDFHTGNYASRVKGRKLLLKRTAGIQSLPFRIAKTISIKSKDTIEASYLVEKVADVPDGIMFGVEFNATMPFLNAQRYHYEANRKLCNDLDAAGQVADTDTFGIIDTQREFAMHLAFSKKADEVWYFPVKTLSQSEGETKRTYQGSCMIPRWKLDFGKGKRWTVTVRWKVGSPSPKSGGMRWKKKA